MQNNLPQLDRAILGIINKTEITIEEKLNCDILYYYGELRHAYVPFYRDSVEVLARRDESREAIGICLTTPGGEVEAVEQMAEITRHNYNKVYFIVPRMAMSAGTIFCMSGDRIFMDYSAALGPVDPQVPDREDKVLVPALGYLDKVNELVLKSADNLITPAEFAILEKQDLAMLRSYEQARDLSKELLKNWLVKYKFASWTEHGTTNPGSKVTAKDKEDRAEEIATMLSDNNMWHSHGRLIGMKTLQEVVRLKIDDFSEEADLQESIRRYSDSLTDYISRFDPFFYIHSRHLN